MGGVEGAGASYTARYLIGGDLKSEKETTGYEPTSKAGAGGANPRTPPDT